MLKSRVVISFVVVLVGLLSVASRARGNAHTNYLTFSAPFALPGLALPAGTYTFEVIVPGSSDVVRVSSRDGALVYFQGFTLRVDRPRGLRADRQIVFSEVQAGVPPSVRAWFPIGETVGHEFIYPGGSARLGATQP